MRKALFLAGLSAVVGALGCKAGHVAGRCDCTNSPESSVIAPPAANYPIIGGGQAATAPSVMPGMTPAPITPGTPEKLPAVNGK